MYSYKLFGLNAVTSIHAGASSSEGAVDLPIQRESHTDWPVIFGSGVKGALRAHFEGHQHLNTADIELLFGPDHKNGDKHAGALMVSDARLVVLPVRSLTSHVKWVSCPALLRRFRKDMERAGFRKLPEVPLVSSPDTALVTDNAKKPVFLEEFRYKPESANISPWCNRLNDLYGEEYRDDLHANFVVLHDDQFRLLCRSAVPVNAHIKIENDTKTVANGALWYEESLPAESLFYLLVASTKAKKEDADSAGYNAATMLAKFYEPFTCEPFFQLGGNATTGMGWMQISALELGGKNEES